MDRSSGPNRFFFFMGVGPLQVPITCLRVQAVGCGGWIPAVTQGWSCHHDAEPWWRGGRRRADAAEENGAPSDAPAVNDQTQAAAANPEKPLAAVACVNSGFQATIAESSLL